MLEAALREDALTATSGGFELRVGLPWIRSMPLSSVACLVVEVDGVAVEPGELTVVLGAREVPADALQAEPGWWFIQDKLVLSCRAPLNPGMHAVAVGFRLLVPYLQARPGSPLVLPFRLEAQLVLDQAPLPGVSRDVG